MASPATTGAAPLQRLEEFGAPYIPETGIIQTLRKDDGGLAGGGLPAWPITADIAPVSDEYSRLWQGEPRPHRGTIAPSVSLTYGHALSNRLRVTLDVDGGIVDPASPVKGDALARVNYTAPLGVEAEVRASKQVQFPSLEKIRLKEHPGGVSAELGQTYRAALKWAPGGRAHVEAAVFSSDATTPDLLPAAHGFAPEDGRELLADTRLGEAVRLSASYQWLAPSSAGRRLFPAQGPVEVASVNAAVRLSQKWDVSLLHRQSVAKGPDAGAATDASAQLRTTYATLGNKGKVWFSWDNAVLRTGDGRRTPQISAGASLAF